MGLDIRLQARSQLYAVGIFMSGLTGVLARLVVPAESFARVLPVFYLLAIGGTTYMFGASMVLFEKSQGTLEALRVSPLTSSRYLMSKVLTLTAFALLECMIVAFVAGAIGRVSFGPLLLGILILAVGLTLVGLGQVARHDSVTSFLMPGAVGVSLVSQLPAFWVLGVGPSWLWWLIPTQGPLRIMLAGELPLSIPEGWLTVLNSAVLVAGGWVYARWSFARHIHLPEATEKSRA